MVVLEKWNGRAITSIPIKTALSSSIYKLFECKLLPVLVRFDEHGILETIWLWANCSLYASHFKIIDSVTHLISIDPLLATVVYYTTVIVILSDNAYRRPHWSIALTISSSPRHTVLHRIFVGSSKALGFILILINIRITEQLGCFRLSLLPLIVFVILLLINILAISHSCSLRISSSSSISLLSSTWTGAMILKMIAVSFLHF